MSERMGFAGFGFIAALGLGAPACAPAKLIAGGDSHELRKGAERTAPTSPSPRSKLLFLPIDGVDRRLLYEMLRAGELPAFARLLGGEGTGDRAKFEHAYFDDTLLATMPSSTMAAWVTALTGVGPARHGVAGNEFFIRETLQFAAPGPVSFSDSAPVAAIYTDGYLNKLSLAPSVYERMRETDPNVLIWVAMHHYYAGADRTLTPRPTVLAQAFEGFVADAVTKVTKKKQTRAVYEALDTEEISVVTAALEKGPVPDVLTVYLSGTDLYGHVADEGPDRARRSYLREVVDPQLARLTERLLARDALKDRYVVVTSDHGHTEVLHDEAHALGSKDEIGPHALLDRAGFRVRARTLDVPKKADFQSVVAFGGALAYVYLADRSGCAKPKETCDWSKPPRYEEDVLPAAEAFFKNNVDGSIVPVMKDKIDMVLTRRPRPYVEDDLPFGVYVGGGKVVAIEAYLKEHPHPTYIETASRLRDLAVGPHGERAGDVLLIAHNGDRETPEERYYFASVYRSWHGSPSKKDSEIPLIVAHPAHATAALEARVKKSLAGEPRQAKVADVLLDLRGR